MGEGHRWEGEDHSWAYSLGQGLTPPPMVSRSCAAASCIPLYFSKRASSYEAPYPSPKGKCPEHLRVPSRLSVPVQLCVYPRASS